MTIYLEDIPEDLKSKILYAIEYYLNDNQCYVPGIVPPTVIDIPKYLANTGIIKVLVDNYKDYETAKLEANKYRDLKISIDGLKKVWGTES